MTSAIRTDRLVKNFGRNTALDGLELNVPQGAAYALVGPNGAGKTTAIKVIMNIMRATGGNAEVLGIPSSQIRGRHFESIGYVSENQELPDWMTVSDFLRYLRPFYPGWDRSLEADLIKQFDIPPDRKLRHLSRGMRMKAALASSLAYHPRLIILDEPFTGLDPLVRDELIQSLLDRAEEATIFISSHDLAEVESFASHIGYLENGKLQFSEDLTSLIGRFREVELTFDVPPPIPAQRPSTWMQMSTAAAVIRFIESCFDPERTAADVRRVFGEPRHQTYAPMSLRSIFLAMAKSRRETA